MNDDEMRGCARASEVIAALESSYKGWELLGALLEERDHARQVWAKTTSPTVRDEWRMRGQMFNAAFRRHDEEFDHAA